MARRLAQCINSLPREMNRARYANWLSGEAQNFVSAGSTPACATRDASVGHRQAQVAVTHPPSGIGGSTPSRRTRLMTARSSSGSGCWPLMPATWVQIPHGSLTDQVVQLVDTRCSERRALTGLGVRLSPWSLVMRCRRGWRPTGSHKAGLHGSIPGPATESVFDAGGPAPSEGS